MSKPTEKRLQITKEQAALLNQAQAEMDAAVQRRNLIAATLFAGHGLTRAELVRLDTDCDPPVLVVKA